MEGVLVLLLLYSISDLRILKAREKKIQVTSEEFIATFNAQRV